MELIHSIWLILIYFQHSPSEIHQSNGSVFFLLPYSVCPSPKPRNPAPSNLTAEDLELLHLEVHPKLIYIIERFVLNNHHMFLLVIQFFFSRLWWMETILNNWSLAVLESRKEGKERKEFRLLSFSDLNLYSSIIFLMYPRDIFQQRRGFSRRFIDYYSSQAFLSDQTSFQHIY